MDIGCITEAWHTFHLLDCMSSSGIVGGIAYNDFDHDEAFLLKQVLKLLYLGSALMAEHHNSPSAPSELGRSCTQKFHLTRHVVESKLLISSDCMQDSHSSSGLDDRSNWPWLEKTTPQKRRRGGEQTDD